MKTSTIGFAVLIFFLSITTARSFEISSTADTDTEGTLRYALNRLSGVQDNYLIFTFPGNTTITLGASDLPAIGQEIDLLRVLNGTTTLYRSQATLVTGLSFTTGGSLLGGIPNNFALSVHATGDDAYGFDSDLDLLITGDFNGTINVTAGGDAAAGIIAGREIIIDGNLRGNITTDAAGDLSSCVNGDFVEIYGDISGSFTSEAENDAQTILALTALMVEGDVSGTLRARALTDDAWAMFALAMLVEGDVSGNITATADSYSAYGIYSLGITEIHGDVSGNISAFADHDAKGIYTGILFIEGGISGNVQGTATTIGAAAILAEGDVAIPGGISGTLTATVLKGNTALGLSAATGGLYGWDPDSPLHISGNISAKAQGQAVAVAAFDGMNIDVSGTLSGVDTSGGNAGYAIRSGADDTSGGWDTTDAADDIVTLSTGASLTGRADLGGNGTAFGDLLILNGTGTLSTTFENTEQLRKTNPGTWSLAANQTVLATNINAGTLAVNATLNSPVSVNTQGTLGGDGIIVGNVINNGTVAPGNSPGTLTINGDYTHGADATLEIEITPTASDLLLVTGNTVVNGGTVATVFSETFHEDGKSYIFVDAQGGRAGTFTALTTNSIFLEMLENNTALTLGGIVHRLPYTIAARTRNARAAAAALSEVAKAGPNAELSYALGVLEFCSVDEAANALDQLHPESYSGLTESSFSAMRLFANSARDRFYANNTNTTQLNTVDAARTLQLAQANALTRYGVTGLNAGPTVLENERPNTEYGFYITPVTLMETHESDTNHTGFDANTIGFVAGADTKLNNNLLVGLQLGYAQSDVRFKDVHDSFARADHLVFGTYAAYETNNFYADGLVQSGVTWNQMSRSIEYTSTFGTTIDYEAQGKLTSFNLAANLSTGYDFERDNVTFGPVATLDYGYVNNPGVTETGAPGLNLDIDANSAHSLKTGLGARAYANFDMTQHVAFVPDASIKWGHEFLNNARSINSSFIGSPNSSFTTRTGEPDRDSLLLGAGVTFDVKGKAAIFMRYTGELASRRQAHAGTLGFRYEF